MSTCKVFQQFVTVSNPLQIGPECIREAAGAADNPQKHRKSWFPNKMATNCLTFVIIIYDYWKPGRKAVVRVRLYVRAVHVVHVSFFPY